MYEICNLLAARHPKAKKARKVAAKSIKVGATVILHGKEAIVVERDTKYANAWFLAIDGARLPHSISRDMVKVV